MRPVCAILLLAAAAGVPADAQIQFEEIGKKAGLDFRLRNAAGTRFHQIELMVGGVAVLAACALSFSDALLLLNPVRGDADQGRLAALLALLAANSSMLGLIPLGAGMILGGALGLARALEATEPTD